MRLSGLVSLLDDLPEFRRLVEPPSPRRRPRSRPCGGPRPAPPGRHRHHPRGGEALPGDRPAPARRAPDRARRPGRHPGPGVVRRPPDLERRPAARPALPRLRRPPLRAAPGGGGDGGGAGGDADPARRGAPAVRRQRHERRQRRRDRRSALPRRHQRPGPADHAAPAGGVRRAGARPPRRRALRHAAPGAPARRQRVRAGGPGGDARLVQPAGGHRGHLPPSRRGPGAPGVLRRRGGEHPGVRPGDAALHRDA